MDFMDPRFIDKRPIIHIAADYGRQHVYSTKAKSNTTRSYPSQGDDGAADRFYSILFMVSFRIGVVLGC